MIISHEIIDELARESVLDKVIGYVQMGLEVVFVALTCLASRKGEFSIAAACIGWAIYFRVSRKRP